MMGVSLRRVLVQSMREWQEFRRDWVSLTLAFVLPLTTLLLIGYGLRLELKKVPVAIEDRDKSTTSRVIAERLFSTNMFVPVASNNSKHAESTLRADRAQVAILLEDGLQKKLDRGEPVTIKAMIDGSDINSAMAIKGVLDNAASSNFFSSSQCSIIPAPRVVPNVRTWFNPGRKEDLYVVPGSFAVILWIFPPLLAAIAAAREIEHGTILRAFTSSLNAMEFMLGKGLVYFAIGMFQALAIFALGSVLFQLDIKGDPLLLLLATMFYVIAAVMFGFIPGFRARSQTVAMQLISTTGFFPALLLSGFVYPISNIPPPLDLFPYFVPAKYFVDVCRDSFVRGAGWNGAGNAVFVLLGFAILFSYFAWTGLHKMQLRSK